MGTSPARRDHRHRLSHKAAGRLRAALESLEPRRLLALAPGDMDSSFGVGGKTSTTYTGPAELFVSAVTTYGNGRYLTAGALYNGEFALTLTRYLSNGNPDGTIGPSGAARFPALAWRSVADLALLPGSEKILALSGDPATASVPMIQRFTADGAVDPTWIGPGTGVSGPPRAMALLGDGRVLVATSTHLARLKSDGTLDPTFGTGGVVAFPLLTSSSRVYPPQAMVVQSDGGILLGGETYTAAFQRQAVLRRHLPDGALDTSFGSGGTLMLPLSTTSSAVSAMKLQPDGNVVMAGHSGDDSFVARVTPAGALDGGFGAAGITPLAASTLKGDKANRLLLAPSGAIYVGGYVDQTSGYVARLTPSGQLDATFDDNGIIESPLPAPWYQYGHSNLTFSWDGKLVMASSGVTDLNQPPDQTLSRYTSAGALDGSFGTGGVRRHGLSHPQSLYPIVRSVMQADGKIVQVGAAGHTARNFAVTRLNANGTFDSAFGNNGTGIVEVDSGAMFEQPTDLFVQPDGKLVIGGWRNKVVPTLTDYTWEDSGLIVRLNADGTPDSTFGTNGVKVVHFTDARIRFDSIALLPDGRMVGGGLTLNDVPSVVRLSSDGTFDAAFGRRRIDLPGSEETLRFVAASGSGVLVAGEVETTPGNVDRYVLRLDANGNFDTTFAAPSGGGAGTGVRVLDAGPDERLFAMLTDPATGQIILAGHSGPNLLLTKLTATGALVTTFGSGGTLSVPLSADVVGLSDLVLGENGDFTISGTAYRTGTTDKDFLVMRLKPDGTLDSRFGTGGIRMIDMGTTSDVALDLHETTNGFLVATGVRKSGTMLEWAAAKLRGRFPEPMLLSRDFRFSPDTLFHLLFDGDVYDSANATDLVAQNLDTGQTFNNWWMSRSRTGLGDTVVDWGSATPLPEGHYRVTILDGALRSAAGQEYGAYSFDVFISNGTAQADHYVLRRGGAAKMQLSRTTGTAATRTWTIAEVFGKTVVWINAGLGADVITGDFTGGYFSGGIWMNLDGGGGGDELNVIANGPGEVLRVTSGTGFSVSRPSNNLSVISAANIWKLSLENGDYGVSQTVTGKALEVKADATLAINAPQRLASLSVAGRASVTGGGNTIRTGSLSIPAGGRLDLANAALVLDYSGVSPQATWNGSAYAGVAGLIASGRNGGVAAGTGLWTGSGLVTTRPAAAADYTTLGFAEASEILGLSGSATALWNGMTVDATSVLVKYTYGGDANLDGILNIDDYGQIDFHAGLSGAVFGYYNGDFNLDGLINVDDYGILDFNVGIQGLPL